ncbi:MAG: 3-oxoacyl-[acyl-carrier-protein] reductase [Chloroflexi bacterium]|nr:MAG: 3-oxoacyl-[acyl-carrier-protein] reductase [Chloroflexota bacterium]
MRELNGQVAIVTGSSRGIGRAIAGKLAENGASVVINYVRSESRARAAAEELKAFGVETLVVQADVTQRHQVDAMVGKTLERFGQIDILVNNAGINRDRTLKNMSPDMWQAVIQAKLDSVFNCTAAVWPHMIERRRGRIVNISSVIGQMGNFGQANYAAANAGIIGFTKSAALEGARFGILVNAVCPGFIETDMVTELPDKVKDAIIQRIPLQRFGRPEEVAQAVLYLVGSTGDYITGQTLNINGGIYM